MQIVIYVFEKVVSDLFIAEGCNLFLCKGSEIVHVVGLAGHTVSLVIT